jgi:uncharacterized membrane protein YfcA
MTTFDVILTAVAALAGAIASVCGFGVGSLLTPVLALHTTTRLAVAAVSIPHVVASGIRFWQLRRSVDWRVVRSFGITSAAGGLTGAVLSGSLNSAVLTVVFAALLIFAGAAGLTGLSERMRFRGPWAWIAGGVSGFFGGLVGNQGGIRSAAMLGFDVKREAFVGTATAVALIVDGARMPAYLVSDGHTLAGLWLQIAAMVVGVIVGTLLGKMVLRWIPERIFRRIVGALILMLGIWMGYRAAVEWRAERQDRTASRGLGSAAAPLPFALPAAADLRSPMVPATGTTAFVGASGAA